jgi:NADH:ubiquinone oxidoreductase subunit 5 (subunit L)/multisubunit Na+/H+ antiporter MnhA subunit
MNNPQLLFALMIPLGAAFLTPLVGRVLGQRVGWWAALVSATSAALLLGLSGAVQRGEVPAFAVDWPAPMFAIRFALWADGWAWSFALLVAGIGTLVCIYAQHYLHEREPRARFFSYLLLFEGAMLGVVLSSNLIMLVVFWELTSVASFLLIGFWHDQAKARYGAYKALLITTIGGLALTAGVILVYVAMGTFDLRELFARAEELRQHALFRPILICLLLGVFTKSAQFPFHFWLPDAMQAPTPVSAYLHSATMVKAGVFLLGRIFPIFGGTKEWFWIVSVVGMATMLLGAYAAVRKTDLKALLAYSTISQLGLITLLYGYGTELAAMAATFHIFNHATFKAGLFLVVGIVDHETGTRDKRVLLKLARFMPITAAICGACALASAGVPLLNGFLSKELFYEASAAMVHRAGVLSWLWPALAVSGSVFTFVYSLEVFHGIFFSRRQELVSTALPSPDLHHGHLLKKNPHDPGWGMLGPAALLAVTCVLVGLWPSLIQHNLIATAVGGVLQKEYPVHIALFHGIKAPLMMSVLTIVAGLTIYLQRHRLMATQYRLSWPFTANTIYDGAFNMLMTVAGLLTDWLQSGRLRRYLWVIILFFVGLVGVIISHSGLAPWLTLPSVTPMAAAEFIMLAVLVITAVCVVLLNNQRLAAVITLGGVGAMVSVLFVVTSAPDLALTQLMVETITTLLFLLVLWFLPKDTPISTPKGFRGMDVVLSVVFGLVIAVMVMGVFATGPVATELTKYYADHSLSDAHGRNIVNVILVDFRGFDTLGETSVLCIAALGAYAMVKLRRKKDKGKTKEDANGGAVS